MRLWAPRGVPPARLQIPASASRGTGQYLQPRPDDNLHTVLCPRAQDLQLRLWSLSGPCRRGGLWLCLGAVGANGLLHVGEEVGTEPVEAFAVIPPDDAGAERKPEDQTGCGGDKSSGEARVAGGIEVED